jgi:hypothetical protein
MIAGPPHTLAELADAIDVSVAMNPCWFGVRCCRR